MAGMMPSPTSAFGRETTPSVAASVMNAPSLNATPSPTDPLQLPADASAKGYTRLLAAAYEIRKTEKDAMALLEIDRVIHFAEDRLTAIVGSDEWMGPPASTPAPPPMPGAMVGAPQAGGAPPAPAMPGPGAGSPPATGGMPGQ